MKELKCMIFKNMKLKMVYKYKKMIKKILKFIIILLINLMKKF